MKQANFQGIPNIDHDFAELQPFRRARPPRNHKITATWQFRKYRVSFRRALSISQRELCEFAELVNTPPVANRDISSAKIRPNRGLLFCEPPQLLFCESTSYHPRSLRDFDPLSEIEPLRTDPRHGRRRFERVGRWFRHLGRFLCPSFSIKYVLAKFSVVMPQKPVVDRDLYPLMSDLRSKIRLIQGFGEEQFRRGDEQFRRGPSAECLQPLRNEVKQPYCLIVFNFSELQHYNQLFKAELTLKAVIGTVIEDFFPRLTSSQRELFGSGPFGQFLNMPIPNGDPLIVHAMMLQEERDIGVGQRGRFRFNVQGLHLEYGDSEFCLITGLKFGPFANLLAGTKNPKNSLLRSRLFPKQTDKSLRLRDIQDFILDPRFLDASDDDAVMLMQIFVLLRGMLGRELKSCIPPLVFELADHPYNWNRQKM